MDGCCADGQHPTQQDHAQDHTHAHSFEEPSRGPPYPEEPLSRFPPLTLTSFRWPTGYSTVGDIQFILALIPISTHAAASPAAAPDSTEAPLPNDLVQHDLLGVDDVQVVSLDEVPGLHGPVEAESELGVGSGHQPVRPGQGGEGDPVTTLTPTKGERKAKERYKAGQNMRRRTVLE